MKIELQRIFDEYRDAESAQVRRNLGTALAAVGDDDSLKRLVNMAMTDPDESVRLRALSELVRLEPNRQTAAVAVIVAAADAKETKGAASYLLAQLQLVGVPISYRPKAIRDGIAGIRASIAYAGRSRKDVWSLAGKSLLAAFTASALGAIVTVAYVQVLIGRMSDNEGAMLSVLLCVLLSGLIVYFVRPFGGYFVESFLTPMVEVTRVLLLPTFFGVVTLFAYVILDPDSAKKAALAILAGLLLIALVRLCTIYGRIAQDNLNRRQMAQIGFGFCASALIMTAAGSILNAVQASSVSYFWIFFLPVTLGLAAFFAQVDRSASLAQAKEPVGRRIIVFSTIAAFAVLLVVPVFRSLGQGQVGTVPVPTVENVELNFGASRQLQVVTPAHVKITTKEPGELSIYIPGDRCHASLFGPLHEFLKRDSPTVSIRQNTTPETYTLEIASQQGKACGPALGMAQTANALGRLFLGKIPIPPTTLVTLRLASADKK